MKGPDGWKPFGRVCGVETAALKMNRLNKEVSQNVI